MKSSGYYTKDDFYNLFGDKKSKKEFIDKGTIIDAVLSYLKDGGCLTDKGKEFLKYYVKKNGVE